MNKSIVYYTSDITPESIIKLYEKLGVKLEGNVAAKIHSGEEGNQNYIKPEFVKPIIDKLSATVVECNTAYGDAFEGVRDHTEGHLKLMENHGWSKYFKVDIMDSEGDLAVEVKNGKHLKNNILGKNIKNYDSMIVLSHFKGHPMGGYGGAIKQLSIGCASSKGKALIHSAGVSDDIIECWKKETPQDTFLECMVDAASTVDNMFKGRIVYINMMINMSVDCDCCAVAEDPCIKDIGILASIDPVAIDKACMDLVENSSDPGKEHFLKRVNERNGKHTIDAAEAFGLGSKEYELIKIN